MAADLVVIVVTWMSTFKTIRVARVAGFNFSTSFSALMLRDGESYIVSSTIAYI